MHTEIQEGRNEADDRVEEEKEGGQLVYVGSVGGARGLDLDCRVDCVLVYGRLGGADEYLHVAGRTGRLGSRGRVVSVVGEEEVGKLRSYEGMLGVRFEELGGGQRGPVGGQESGWPGKRVEKGEDPEARIRGGGAGRGPVRDKGRETVNRPGAGSRSNDRRDTVDLPGAGSRSNERLQKRGRKEQTLRSGLKGGEGRKPRHPLPSKPKDRDFRSRG